MYFMLEYFKKKTTRKLSPFNFSLLLSVDVTVV